MRHLVMQSTAAIGQEQLRTGCNILCHLQPYESTANEWRPQKSVGDPTPALVPERVSAPTLVPVEHGTHSRVRVHAVRFHALRWHSPSIRVRTLRPRPNHQHPDTYTWVSHRSGPPAVVPRWRIPCRCTGPRRLRFEVDGGRTTHIRHPQSWMAGHQLPCKVCCAAGKTEADRSPGSSGGRCGLCSSQHTV